VSWYCGIMTGSRPDTKLAGAPYVRFSASHLPPSHRMEIWREVFGREVIRLDMAPLEDGPIFHDAVFRDFGSAALGLGVVSSISCERTAELLGDGNNDIILLIPIEGTVSLQQRGAELVAHSGDVLVRRSDDAGRTLSSSGRYMTVTLPARVMECRVADIDRLTMTVLPRGTNGLSLLTGYVRMLMAEERIDPATLEMISLHIADLAGCAIGARREEWHVANLRGLAAARLRQIHAAIRFGAANEGFSIAEVAGAMRVTPSYIRKLLASEGDTFTALVLQRRLDLAFEALSDPARDTSPISRIALDAGFGDVSYFNRAFRKRYDATPRDIRAAREG